MRVTAPYAYGGGNWPNHGGPPTDFTADASGAGMQPLPDSNDWSNLLTVKSFQPPLVQGTDGIFSHLFEILPQDGYSASQGTSLDDLELSLDDQPGTSQVPIRLGCWSDTGAGKLSWCASYGQL